jgi:hypothetical protein
VATLTFDGLRRILWISPLAEAAAYSAGDLCRRHAERMQAPRNWEVRDTRPRPSDTASAGSAAPSRYVAPPPPPPEPLPFERPAARRPATTMLARGGSETFRDAHTPMLARAFRTAR